MINKNCGGASRAGRLHRRRQGDPRRGRRALRQGARGDGPAGDHQIPRRRVGRGSGRQPLFRRRGAVGEEEDRPQAHGDHPLCDRRGGAAGGHPRAPVRRTPPKAARALGPGRRSPHIQGAGRGGRLKPGTVLPEPAGVFPRYVAPEADEPPEKPEPKPKKEKPAKDKGPEGQRDARRPPLPPRFPAASPPTARGSSRAPRRPASASW